MGTIYVSTLPIPLLLALPSGISTTSLNALLAFAAGGLLGDVFLHLLPHTFYPHDHGHDPSHDHHHKEHARGTRIGLAVLAGFGLFFLAEKIMRITTSGHGGHHHGPPDEEKKKKEEEEESEAQGKSSSRTSFSSNGTLKKRTTSSPAPSVPSIPSIPSASTASTAYLNLLADATHNLTDGLAMAAAFQASHTLGISTTLACLVHELPHEIGDYAILIRAGFSRGRAIQSQLITASGALLGCVLGSWVGSYLQGEWVVGGVAGGFLYVAAVGVIATLVEEEKGHPQGREAIKRMLGQAGAFSTGVFLMYLVGYLE
ncbi:MAG: Zinc/iron permease [Piptocephalis tieghemiana]|nr:MAG: Zinc/iron permease [Piptocephalis tieghemiana]